jgi:hypothetical protein
VLSLSMMTISSTSGKIDSTDARKNVSSFFTRIMADMRLRRNPPKASDLMIRKIKKLRVR